MENNAKIWKVYKYTCKHNGLIYIGITSKTLDQRWANGNGYRNNPRLDNAIKKYGIDGFTREILFNNLTQEEAAEIEVKLIAEYNATDKSVGFNVAVGGTAPMFGRKHSKETSELFSENRRGEHNPFYGKHHTEETRRRFSEQRKGIKHTEEWKRGQSERSKEWHKTHENPMKGNHRFAGENNPMYGERGGDSPSAIPVIQLDMDGNFVNRFESITEAAQSIGLYNGSHITECCKGKRHKCGGYMWKFVDKESEDNE